MPRKKRKVVEKEKPKGEFVPYSPPKLKFLKKGISYKEGDHVEVIFDGVTYAGILNDILSSQLVVKLDDNPEIYKFFFHRGIAIRKVK